MRVKQVFTFLLHVSLLACVSSVFMGLEMKAAPYKTRPVAFIQKRISEPKPSLWGQAVGHCKEVISSLSDTIPPGSLGRLVSVLVLHPLDSMKTRAQVVSMQTRRTSETVLFRSAGAYKGVLSAIAGQIPNGLLTCVGYELWKDVLDTAFPGMAARTRTVASALLGDLCGHAWIVPAEVVKCQVMAGLHKNAASAVLGLAQQGPGAFFKGYKAQVARDVPYRALQLILFDELSTALVTFKERRLTLVETLCTGAVAGSLAAAITTPLDLVKSRLMLSAQSTTIRQALQAAQKDGIRVLAGSIVPKMVYVSASTGAFFLVYEFAKRRGFLASR